MVPIVEGRDFEPRDSEPDTPSAAIVSTAFARQYFGGGRVVGRVYEQIGQGTPVRQEIVGVVADLRQDDIRIACLLIAGCLAALPAARRMARLDPVTALRAE